MTFIWPRLLWLLLLLPLLVACYWWLSARQEKVVGQYVGLQQDRPSAGGWRRILPLILMLAAITSMLFAVSRPVAEITLPSKNSTIILAIDLSGSMKATDIEPSRLEAAQSAIREFLHDLPLSTRVGIVTFGASAATIQSPTLSRDQLLNAVDRFELRQGTAIGGGIVMALKTLFPKITINSQSDAQRWGRAFGAISDDADTDAENKKSDSGATVQESDDKPIPYPVEPGSNKTAAIILLSDGQNNSGPNPLEMAKLVSEYGVPIYTVGFGTEKGAVIGSEGRSMRVTLDEKTLRAVAETTLGEYFKAATAGELEQVYENLSAELVFEKQRTEVSSLFGLLGALLGLIAAGLSLFWFNRVF
ncbi:MAG: VWA domain-containing protein [Burkholderiaceae bacterium]